MKIGKLLLLFSLLIGSTFIMGCRKQGCTDSNAINYNEAAKKDDASCEYEATVILWYKKPVIDFLENFSTKLYFWVNYENIAERDISVYWDKQPNCGDVGLIKTTIFLDGHKKRIIDYEVKDENDLLMFTGNIEVRGGACHIFELHY